MSRRWACALATAMMAIARPARAARPCIVVDVESGVVDAAGRGRLLEQLGAALDRHGLDMCGAPAESALGSVQVVPGPRKRVTIRVHDDVTQKETARDVDVTRFPLDGRPLAIALAADELLRASWAEVVLAPASSAAPPAEPTTPPPPEVRAAVKAAITPSPEPAERADAPTDDALPSAGAARPKAVTLGAAFAGEHATGGVDALGADLRFEGWVLPRIALTLRAGFRQAPSARGAHGTTDTSILLAGAGAAVALLPRGRPFGIDLVARVDAERVQLTAHPDPGARGADATGIAVVAGGGASASYRFGAVVSLFAEATAGGALRSVQATDAGAEVTALAGAVLGGAVGVRGAL